MRPGVFAFCARAQPALCQIPLADSNPLSNLTQHRPSDAHGHRRWNSTLAHRSEDNQMPLRNVIGISAT